MVHRTLQLAAAFAFGCATAAATLAYTTHTPNTAVVSTVEPTTTILETGETIDDYGLGYRDGFEDGQHARTVAVVSAISTDNPTPTVVCYGTASQQ